MDTAAVARELAELLHNTHEHAETLVDVLERGQATGEFRSRLLRHIDMEESRNAAELVALEQRAGTGHPFTHEMAVLKDHQQFIRGIARGDGVAAELVPKLLHHFMEEHLAIFERLGFPRGQGLHTMPLPPGGGGDGARASPSLPAPEPSAPAPLPPLRAATIGSWIGKPWPPGP